MSLKNCIKRAKMRVFRRLYMKRRLSGGEYESTWQEVPTKYIKKWGQIAYDTDVVKPNWYNFSDFNFDVVNNDGYFSGTDNAVSFWYGALTRYRTLVKVEAGYIDTDETEYPTTTTLFLGIMTEDLKQNYDNIVKIAANHISYIFKEIPAIAVGGLGSTQTASELITKVRDFQDGNLVSVFQKYITSGAWHISTTTTYYNMATTSSLDGMDCWEFMTKLAEAENHVMYVSRDGELYFQPRGDVASVSVFHFSGIGESSAEYGHNIMKRLAIDDGISNVYNRVRVQHDDSDTLSSFYTKEEDWNWGDSSSSFLYGVRTYDYENEWLNTAGATTVGDAIFTEFQWPKLGIDLDAKFVPQLNLYDRVSLTYRTRTPMGGDLWGYFLWGSGVWAGQAGFNINISDSEYKVIAISHDLEKFISKVQLREI